MGILQRKEDEALHGVPNKYVYLYKSVANLDLKHVSKNNIRCIYYRKITDRIQNITTLETRQLIHDKGCIFRAIHILAIPF